MQAPLITVSYADTVASSAQWVAGSVSDKEGWILQASVWIASSYLCADYDTDGVGYACALLADKAAQGLLYPASATTSTSSISSKSVSVGDVSCSTEYMTANGVDPLRYVRDILGAECSRIGQGCVIPLQRG